MAEISVPQKWQDNHQGNEAKLPRKSEQKKMPVIYYLSRNGQLEHPHFMVVPLSSPKGLFLKDVIIRLTSLRGQGIASMYSWSSKRSYKNGFVWHDLSEDDLIYPCQGQEYVLKGSQIPERSLSFRSFESADSSFSSSSSSAIFSCETISPDDEYLSATIPRRKNMPCGLYDDLRGHRVCAASGRAQEPEAEALGRDRTAENSRECGRTKASTVLMDLIKCGSMKRKD